MSHDRESGSNGKKMTFGKKVSGLLSKLTKVSTVPLAAFNLR
jgi:hypothetical protein